MTLTISKGHSVISVSTFIDISRQSYYKRLHKDARKNELYNYVEAKVLENRNVKSRAGLRSIYYKEELSTLLGINQFEQEMSLRGHSLKPYRSLVKTTDSRGHHFKFPNRIAGMHLCGANQVIVGDITYYRSRDGVLYYIFHFVDYYTLEVKGLVGSRNMNGINAEKCLRQVFSYNNTRKYNFDMIIHTDAGGQYRSNKFQQMLRDAEITPSQAATCMDNGLSERENGILKNEYLVDYDIKSVSHLNRALKKIKTQINEVWPSQTLGYLSPGKYAEWVKNLDKNQKPIKIVKNEF